MWVQPCDAMPALACVCVCGGGYEGEMYKGEGRGEDLLRKECVHAILIKLCVAAFHSSPAWFSIFLDDLTTRPAGYSFIHTLTSNKVQYEVIFIWSVACRTLEEPLAYILPLYQEVLFVAMSVWEVRKHPQAKETHTRRTLYICYDLVMQSSGNSHVHMIFVFCPYCVRIRRLLMPPKYINEHLPQYICIYRECVFYHNLEESAALQMTPKEITLKAFRVTQLSDW